MTKKRRYKDAQDKRESGGFVPFPSVVLRSKSYALLGPHAVKLLNDLMAQYQGDNNGDLCAAWTLMKERGWKSRDTLQKALKGLLAGEWLVVARQGGRHVASLYAITFFNVDPCGGKLDIVATHRPMSLWRKHEPCPPLVNNSANKGFSGNTPGVLIPPVITRRAC